MLQDRKKVLIFETLNYAQALGIHKKLEDCEIIAPKSLESARTTLIEKNRDIDLVIIGLRSVSGKDEICQGMELLKFKKMFAPTEDIPVILLNEEGSSIIQMINHLDSGPDKMAQIIKDFFQKQK